MRPEYPSDSHPPALSCPSSDLAPLGKATSAGAGVEGAKSSGKKRKALARGDASPSKLRRSTRGVTASCMRVGHMHTLGQQFPVWFQAYRWLRLFVAPCACSQEHSLLPGLVDPEVAQHDDAREEEEVTEEKRAPRPRAPAGVHFCLGCSSVQML